MALNLTPYLADLAGAGGALQALAQQRHHLAVFAAALASVLVEDDFVEGGAQDLGLFADVLVAPVACAADHHRAVLSRHGVDSRATSARMASGLWP